MGRPLSHDSKIIFVRRFWKINEEAANLLHGTSPDSQHSLRTLTRIHALNAFYLADKWRDSAANAQTMWYSDVTFIFHFCAAILTGIGWRVITIK